MEDKVANRRFSSWKSVPDAFYDIVCRVIPGSILVVGVTYYKKESLDFLSNVYVFLTVLAIGYVVGLVLDCLSSWITTWLVIRRQWNLLQRYWLKQDEETKAGLLKKAKLSNETMDIAKTSKDKKRILETIRDWVRQNCAEAVILTKVIAEERLLRNLAIGFPVCIVGAFVWSSDSGRANTLEWKHLILAIVIETAVILAAWKRVDRTIVRTFFWWLGSEWRKS